MTERDRQIQALEAIVHKSIFNVLFGQKITPELIDKLAVKVNAFYAILPQLIEHENDNTQPQRPSFHSPGKKYT